MMKLLQFPNRKTLAVRAGLSTVLCVTLFFSGFSFLQSKVIQNNTPKIILALVAIMWGVGTLVLLFYAMNGIIILFSEKMQSRLEPILFVGPATLILSWYLLFPTLRSLYISLLDKRGQAFVGLENYKFIFTNDTMLVSFRNNLVWLVIGTLLCVVLGLTAAILSDKVKYEKIVRAIVFMPLAISFVGAGIIWKFVYAYRTSGIEQIGILNAMLVYLGFEPVNWLLLAPWNTFFLIVIFVWVQTGFAMVILSAAIKGVPKEILEAARIDGVGEFNIILHIVIPHIKGTLVTISTTILILTLKIFDIVYSMTNGLYGTEVLASQQYKFMFKFLHYGRGSAIAVIIFVVVIPVIIYNLSRLNKGYR